MSPSSSACLPGLRPRSSLSLRRRRVPDCIDSKEMRQDAANFGRISDEANAGTPSHSEVEQMARRRFQAPAPFREGHFWWLLHWQDDFADGKRIRKRKRSKLAPASTSEREVKKIAAELLRPQNQGLVSVGSATSFNYYVENEYEGTVLPLMAKATQDRYRGIIENYLNPSFGKMCLRDLTALTLQKYFSGMATSKL